jgi:choline dehydrogenase-like flavoprotein
MLHQIQRSATCLSDRERATFRAIAEAAMPAGRFLPAAGDRTVARAEAFLAALPSPVRSGYRGFLAAADAAAYARYLRPLAKLDAERRVKVLDGWRTGNYLLRSMLRMMVLPLKLAHFDDPSFYSELGCVFDQERPKQPERPRWMAERVVRAVDLDADEAIECDVVVVGTGAGGAVVARELAEAGHAVVLIEEGEYYTRSDFSNRTLSSQGKLYRDMGSTITLGNTGIPLPIGMNVGGSTTINSGTCYRVPDRVLAKWRDDFGLTEITPDAMAPYFERVEQVIGVGEARREHLGGAARVIARGCERLGYKHKPLRRNAPDCDGKGVCCFGCPTDAKRSTNVSYVPLALRAGAQLFTGARVERILAESGRATGVEARARGGHRARLTVRAKRTVVACGTLYTPVLLERSGLAGSSGELGKNLSIHPAAAVLGWFDETIAGYNAIPQGYSIEQFHDEGILFEGGTTPLDLAAATLPFVGRSFVELAESYDHVAMFGFMIEDTSRGRVFSSKAGRPIITYILNDADVARIKRGTEILARVYLAAGARKVYPMVHGFDVLQSEADLTRFRRARLSARDFDLTAYHPLGTARMGLDPARSVVGPDHRVHDVRDLYVTDGAAVPSSLAVNPQVTIMAMATRAAEKIAASLN